MINYIIIILIISNSINNINICNNDIGVEYISDESKRILPEYSDIIDNQIRDKSMNGSIQAVRLQHPKSHGCIFGEFSVIDNLPANLSHGIFQPGSKYPVIIRLSNSGKLTTPDSGMQARGISMKLFNVSGLREMRGVGWENYTQDFLFISSDFFFTNDPISYPDLLRAIGGKSPELGVIKWIFNSYNPITWISRIYYFICIGTVGYQGSNVINLLNWNYYSATPYLLGKLNNNNNHVVKYSLIPCDSTIYNKNVERDKLIRMNNPRNFLSEILKLDMTGDNGGACFKFQIQSQLDPCYHPIEDPIISWDSPWIHVANVVFKSQEFSTKSKMRMCDDFTFNPWNTISDHRPMGSINLARKTSYHQGSITRYMINYNGTKLPYDPELPSY